MIFHVKDNGVGIPKDKQQNIFKKFYQVDTSHTRKHGGTGLGLVICKGIVNALGGEIWFESDPRKGTEFYFSTPIYGEKISGATMLITQNDKKSLSFEVDKTRELEQEKIIFKELYRYLDSHEKFSEKVFDAMSHELRTPTVAIKAYTEMLLEGKFGDLAIQQKEKLERIKKNIDLLINAIFSLLQEKNKETRTCL